MNTKEKEEIQDMIDDAIRAYNCRLNNCEIAKLKTLINQINNQYKPEPPTATQVAIEKENQPNTNKRPDIEDIRLMVKTEKLRQKCGSFITYEDWAKTATKLCDHIEYLEKQLEISENKANAISSAWMKDHFTRIIDN